ncbi:hypothetical protein HYX08_02950 [Candidatus Woesearchaeota archaeon]|nr:hypothetical protein [Candidatus Woesearchaeota archaeon]
MIKSTEPVQKLVAIKPHPDMVEFVRELLLHETSEHLAWDETGLEGVLLAVSTHEILQGHKSKTRAPDRINILKSHGNFIYVELTYKDEPSNEENFRPILFNRRYTYLVDTYPQSAMLMDTKF